MILHRFLLLVAVPISGVARPRPTRACALPSTFQGLPLAVSFESRDSTMDQTKINYSVNNHKTVTNINATYRNPVFHKSAYEASSGVRIDYDYCHSRYNVF